MNAATNMLELIKTVEHYYSSPTIQKVYPKPGQALVSHDMIPQSEGRGFESPCRVHPKNIR